MHKPILSCSLFLTLALALVPTAIQAQKSYAIALGGGAAIPVGKLSDNQKTGFNAMAAFAIGVADLPFGFRIDALYNNLSHTGTVSGGTAPSDLRVQAAIANAVFAFPGTSAKAYVLAGAGIYNSKADTPGAKSESDWGFNGGLGATFGFGPFAMFMESRYHSISRNESKGGVYQFVPITLGLMF
jgi:hypothetical protein